MLAAKFKITDALLIERIGGREGKLTPRQADAILDLQLYRLTKLSTEEILKELTELREKIAEYEAILGSEKKLRGVVTKELEEIKKNSATSGARSSRMKAPSWRWKILSPTSRSRSRSATPAT